MTATPRFIVPLPWLQPPLSQNQALHWTEANEQKQAIKQAVVVLVKQQLRGANADSPPIKPPVEVVLRWTVTDRGRRDTDNPVPTLKAAIDGLVAAKFIPDDHWLIVPRSYVQIQLGRVKGLQLEVFPYVETTVEAAAS
jgi:crossover junction endodeoxyribonuclease RusA